MNHPVATVIIPTHDHAATLDLAVQSALDQTLHQVDVVVVGDGVGDDTREVMARLCEEDDRVRFLDLPKGPNHGEVYRGHAVEAAPADVICYLCDDDLFLDDHVEAMVDLLAGAHLVQSLNGFLDAGGTWCPYIGDLSLPECRAWLLRPNCNSVSITGTAHTASSYRRLPHGWRTTPPGAWPDHYMAQQFLAQPWVRAATASRVTALQFPSHAEDRSGWTPEMRRAEVGRWGTRLADPAERVRFDEAVRSAMVASATRLMLRTEQMEVRVRELQDLVHYMESRDLQERSSSWWP